MLERVELDKFPVPRSAPPARTRLSPIRVTDAAIDTDLGVENFADDWSSTTQYWLWLSATRGERVSTTLRLDFQFWVIGSPIQTFYRAHSRRLTPGMEAARMIREVYRASRIMFAGSRSSPIKNAGRAASLARKQFYPPRFNHWQRRLSIVKRSYGSESRIPVSQENCRLRSVVSRWQGHGISFTVPLVPWMPWPCQGIYLSRSR